MGNCNLNCCRCIEKKETQLNQISTNHLDTSTKNDECKDKIVPIKIIECSKYVSTQKENKDSKYEEKISFYSLDDDDKNETKRSNKTNKFNETTQSCTNSKDVSFIFSKKNINSRYDCSTPELNLKSNKNDTNKENNNFDNISEYNNEEDEEINEKIKPFNSYGYYSIDFKKSNFNIYYFDNKNIEDKKTQGINIKHSNIFPYKYNYQKDKYISYFSDDNI